MASEDISVESRNLQHSSPVCLLCLKSVAIATGIVSRNRKRRHEDDDDTQKEQNVYQRFISFCVHYLKVDGGVVDGLQEGEIVSPPPEKPRFEDSFCGQCEQLVGATLKSFAEWTDLRVKLLGNVNKLGITIRKSTDKCTRSDRTYNGIHSFREQVESFLKTQIILPTVQLPPSASVETEKISPAKRTVSRVGRTKSRRKHELGCGSTNEDTQIENSQNNDLDDSSNPPFCEDLEDPLWCPETGDEPSDSIANLNRPFKKRVKWKSSRAQTTAKASSDIKPEDCGRSKQKVSKKKTVSATGGSGTSKPFRYRPHHYYTCSECHIKFRRRPAFFEHSLKVHEGVDLDKFLECSVCQKRQDDVMQLYSHLKYHQNENSFKVNIFCVQCPEAFISQQLADLHRRLEHTKCPQILCENDQCEGKFTFLSDYNEHLKCHRVTDESVHCCPSCGRRFLSLYHLELHKLHHLPKNDEGCIVCPVEECSKNNKYRNVNKLVNHYNKQHLPKSNQVMLHRCDQCKESPFFIFRKELLIHLKSHAREVQCQFCKETFIGHNALRVHQFNKHPDEFKGNLVASRRQEGPVENEATNEDLKSIGHGHGGNIELTLYRTCPYCSNKFLTFQDLEKHKFKDHQILGIQPPPTHVQCDLCGLTVLKPQLSRHMICHTEPHLPCPYPPCPKKFRREANLSMHVKKIHDRKECDREFVCEACGKRYLSRGILNRHVKEQHMKTLNCQFCPKRYSTIGRLNEHLRASHTDDKFQCKWCPNEYSWLTKLKVHAKKKHPEQAHLLSSIYNYAMKPTISHEPIVEEGSEIDGGQVPGSA